MPSGIEKTFQLFANTDNHAAVPVLVDALDSPYSEVREGALSALLHQRHAVAQRALVQRWRKFTPVQRTWIELSGISLEIAVRELIQSNDHEQFALGLEVLNQVPEYELIPALALIVRDSGHSYRDSAGNTLVHLAASLRKDLRTGDKRVGHEAVRNRAIDSLGDCISHYQQHESVAILEAFLVLVTRENQLLREAWNNTKHPAHSAIIRFLRHSSRPEIIDLVLSSLTEMHPSAPVLNIIGLRHDPAFMSELTARLQGNINDNIRRNLARLNKVAWAEEHRNVLEKLNGLQQAAAVHMSMCTSISSDRLYELLLLMASSQHSSGRLAALEELASYVDPQTNELILDAVSDPNAAVRAEALRQLRPRGIPGAIKLLLQHLDSPQLIVQDTVRNSLAEFNFPRFLSAFDKMSPDAQKNTGRLVRGIDVNTQRLLANEMVDDASYRRLRALKIIEVMDNHLDMEVHLIKALQHEDHFLRAEAARLLGRCPSSASVTALRQAMLDRNVRVRENAEASLRRINGNKVAVPSIDTSIASEEVATQERRPMAFLWQFVILADQPPAGFSAMGEHFRAENAHFNLPHFIILALVVLVIASLIWALTRWQESETAWNVDNPQRLFAELCKKHELNSKDTSLLKKIGRELQLTHPASIFCDPSLLVSAMKLEKFHDLHSQLAKLGEEFFGYHLWKQAIASDNSVHQEASLGQLFSHPPTPSDSCPLAHAGRGPVVYPLRTPKQTWAWHPTSGVAPGQSAFG